VLTYLKFKWQRIWRRQLRRLRGGWRRAGHDLHVNVFAKWRQVRLIRRAAIAWWVVIVVSTVALGLQTQQIAAKGMVLQPMAGGDYVEGVVGGITTINPILPDNSASADATRLVFNGLTRFDANGELQPDLASSWQVSPDGKTYSFKLRDGVKWHDGVPFTAQDVAFTVIAIQNPDTRSPLVRGWQGVRVETPDSHTVVMTLPKPYTPFINATTVGILPRHMLESVEPKTMRVAPFNQAPVGTGPFKFGRINAGAGELTLSANPDYFNRRPLIDTVTLRSYDSSDQAYRAYTRRQVMGVARLQPEQLSDAAHSGTMKLYEAGVPDQVGVFFQTTKGVTADKAVRTALARATDRATIVSEQLGGQAAALNGPVVAPGLRGLGALPHAPTLDAAQARAALDADGWLRGRDGVRQKNGQRLELKLVTQSGGAYEGVARRLAEQWGRIGVSVQVSAVDATALQQSYIRPRNYDALLYGINVGADPDVYPYWHSSQASDPGLNLSAYKSAPADAALEAGRTLQDPATRAAKYRSFLQAWMNDTPAIMLYSPTYAYGVSNEVHGVQIKRLIAPSDRFSDIQHWAVRVRAVPAR
jgi:peptide/nickel transport system substrate-binding protein